jgi:hypothetical protein
MTSFLVDGEGKNLARISITAEHNKHPLQAFSYVRLAARSLAYSSEVGEAFRQRLPKLVPWAYGLTGVYIVGDIFWRLSGTPPEHYVREGLDACGFHLMASLALPTAAVAGTVKVTNGLIKVTPFPSQSSRWMPLAKWISESQRTAFRKWTPTLAGLAVIPLVIQPIDELAEHILDLTYRPWWRNNYENKVLSP